MYSTIMIGYDGGEQGADALALAQLFIDDDTDRVLVANVHPAPLQELAVMDPALPEEMKLFSERIAQEGCALLPRELAPEPITDLASSAAKGLYELAEREKADLIVVSSSRLGPKGHVLIGSVAERLFEGGPCAVAVAPVGLHAEDAAAIETIGVAYNGYEESEAALDQAESLALRVGARLRVYNVFTQEVVIPAAFGYGPVDDHLRKECAQEVLDKGVERLDPAVHAEGELIDGHGVAKLLAQAAAGDDLLVVGSRGYGPLRRVMLGSTSGELVRSAPCPVLVIPRGASSDLKDGAQREHRDGAEHQPDPA